LENNIPTHLQGNETSVTKLLLNLKLKEFLRKMTVWR